ncbi:RNA polymerase sigma factor [Sorangium sp. So ce542]|uniref:RNA polymerase sigma factor n=1 Tax=Sorangium sp. So ce542 TaxID=3133316 RepID=UPI003F64093F
MAISGFDVALWHLVAFALAAIYRAQRQFAAKRISPAELAAQSGLVRALIARSLRSTQATNEDVKDLAQDVLLAAWVASEEDRYRPAPDIPPMVALRGWLRRLAYHHVSHHVESARWHREEIVADLPDLEHAAPSAEQSIEDEEMRLAMLEAIRQLPDIEGDVVFAHDIDELAMEEIAEQLGEPRSTLYKRRLLGIAALVKALRAQRG